jgi:hypothetical protein
VAVATSTDAYFADSVGYRVTWRIGHTVPRPNRLGTLTVAATGYKCDPHSPPRGATHMSNRIPQLAVAVSKTAQFE